MPEGTANRKKLRNRIYDFHESLRATGLVHTAAPYAHRSILRKHLVSTRSMSDAAPCLEASLGNDKIA